MTPTAPQQLHFPAGGVDLAGEADGSGPTIVLLHGLTATRRYVLLGSRLLARRGYRLLAYDARGHGESSPAPDRTAYEYRHLAADLAAVLDRAGLDRAVLVGSSMGAATAMALALDQPGRVEALVQITPAFLPGTRAEDPEVAQWHALADGLEDEGVDGFMAAWERAYRPAVEARWAETVTAFTRQRLERHRHPGAVADALRVVPTSTAFESLDQLEHIEVPMLIVATRDDADPAHPLSVAEAYAERLPQALLLVEEPGRPPIAWRGAQLSRAIEALLERTLAS